MQKLLNEKNRTEMKNGAAERAEAVRAEADRIASQILTLTRNGLFVSLRFLDLALCQFEYINSEKIRGIATTGQHIVYNSQYVIESYMKDRQSLSRDYLHMVLHCVFRHPFVSENLHEEYWNLAADIAVETIIDELDLKQTSTNDCDEVREEVARIEKMMRHVTAEQIYQMLLSGSVAQKDIERWRKLFYRDDHRVWWEIARQIAEELKRRQEEEAKKDEPPESERENREDPRDEEDENQEEEHGEDDGTDEEEGQESETSEESGEESEEESEDAGESGGDSDEEDEEEGQEGSEEAGEDGGEDSEEDDDDDREGSEQSEDDGNGDDFDEYEEEYSSTPGQSMERENPDDLADPDSDTQESGNDSDGEGSGGGKPDGNDPQQSDEEGTSRKNDQTRKRLRRSGRSSQAGGKK